ncbi:hypothetical protein PDG61_24205 [Mycolicibacterium sp. BiH015]|uniref:hypothetical protein n=1 Tax=Mycolicibacterium sp. BiH015 TaxID=3018808 RepID=UPI0022DEE635|nr:hypothetical protein [Mycolicibacterium sp. BiH015]MDA2894032.1 hypothetical protein [Mycolicibacterium sp. BiH015]
MRTGIVRAVGALLAVSSAVLHASSPGVVTIAMGAACLYCAYELWRFDTVRSWLMVAVMNVAMIAVHIPMTGHRHGGGQGPVTRLDMAMAMQLATAVAFAEIVFAAAVLYVRTRAPR